MSATDNDFAEVAALLERLGELDCDVKDYLRTWECSADQVEAVYSVACILERLHRNNVSTKAFESGVAVSNFRDKSTRTRAAFVGACSMLGLTIQDFDESKSQLGHGETVRESASMLSFLTEAIGIRDDLYLHEGSAYQNSVRDAVQESYEEGVLPQRPTVVNLQCDQDHPTQSMSDLIHLAEHFGGLDKLKGKRIAVTWAHSPSYGKPLSVPQGLITLLTRFGMDVALAHPEGYELLPHTMESAAKFAAESGGSFTATNSMADAFKGADVVYPKSWAPVHVMEKRVELLKGGSASAVALEALEKECIAANAKFVDWECTEEMMKLTGSQPDQEALYCHCLPADITGVSCKAGEVAASVFDRHRLATYREARHKPFVIAAAILMGRCGDVPALLRSWYNERVPRGPSLAGATTSAGEKQHADQSLALFAGIEWPTGTPKAALDTRVAELAQKYAPIAAEILAEAVRIPEDHVAEDPACGTSNHEGPRVKYLREAIIKHGAVENESDVEFDDFGNLVWWVSDPNDGVAAADKKVIFFDGHTDTVNPLPTEWTTKTGGVDVYKGLVDASRVNEDFLRSELGYLPPKSEWDQLMFGRGTADQLSGVVAQIVATKIMLELRSEGALRGVLVRAYGTVAEEDNDGGGPMFVMKHVLPAHPEWVPDVVIHTEGTGDKDKGACGIYIGQRGRMQIEVSVTGVSCHGSMPWAGRNPLEYGALIIAEARKRYELGQGFLSDPFLGGGTRVASWGQIDTPSNCAVPAKFTFRFDRRLTVGESPEMALADVEAFAAVATARNAGLTVEVRVPHYANKTWRGYTPGNEEIYMGWMTPPEHEAVQTAYAAYTRVVSNELLADKPASHKPATGVPKVPRVDRWIFSTDGVGYPIKKDNADVAVPASKRWVEVGDYKHPAQIGMGIGFEQNTHKIGEFIDKRHFPAAIAFCARFPSLYAARCENK